MEDLPFTLVDMSYDELMNEIATIDQEDIPSDGESVVEDSDDDFDTGQIIQDVILDPSSDSDSEDGKPLSIVQAKIKASTSGYGSQRDWSKHKSPKSPENFISESGVTEKVKNMESPSPGKIYQLFLDDEILDLIVFQTNLYSQQTSDRPKLTTREEVKTFLAINLLMGLKRLPSYRDYWSTSPEFHDPYISSLMTVKRFSWLLSNLHLNDNAIMPKRGEPGYDKLYKLRPFLNLLSQNFESCMSPTKEVCIDESMIKFKGRSSLKQYLPKKPIKRGYKVWILATKMDIVKNLIFTRENRMILKRV